MNDLFSQYLEVLHARRALFDFDVLGGVGCDVDLANDVSDDSIDWVIDPDELLRQQDIELGKRVGCRHSGPALFPLFAGWTCLLNVVETIC